MSLNLDYLLFLIPLFIIGTFCSYTDIRYKRIFNKWIIGGFVYVFFLYCFLFFKDNFYILNLILNGLISFLLGYSLWYFKLWSAGDAKLFSLYAFLIPLNFYSKSYVSYFPSFNLLINLFIPILLIIIISAITTSLRFIFRIIIENKKRKKIRIKDIFQFFLYLFFLFLNYVFVFIILQSVIIPLTKNFFISDVFKNPFFIFTVLLLTISSFHKKRKKIKELNIIFYSVILIYIYIVIFWQKDFNLLINMIKVSFVFMVFIGLTRAILNFYIEKKEIKMIKVNDIKEGMVIVERNNSFFSEKIKGKIGKIDAGGINKEQTEMIKNYFKDKKYLEIKIYKTFPFAPFLFLSAVISITTKSSFLLLLDRFFQYLLR